MLFTLLPTPANMSSLLWLDRGFSSEPASPKKTKPNASWITTWNSPWDTEPDDKEKPLNILWTSQWETEPDDKEKPLNTLWTSVVWSHMIRGMYDSLMNLTKENGCTVLGTPNIGCFAAILKERMNLEPGNPDYIGAILLPKIWKPNDTLVALWKGPGEGTLMCDIALQIHRILETDESFRRYRGRPTWFRKSLLDWRHQISLFTWLDSSDGEEGTKLILPGFERGLRNVTLEELIGSLGSKKL